VTDHLVTPLIIQRRVESLVPCAPERRPNLSSVKWLSKKAIWCSKFGLGALVLEVEIEKW
jgi:hypothetical protein